MELYISLPLGSNDRMHGIESLAPVPKSGRPRTFTAEEEQEVYRWIVGGDPWQLGLNCGLRIRNIITDQIDKRLGISLGFPAVGDLLHRLRLSLQKPFRRAYERDEQALTD